jgi:integrase
MRLKRFQRGSLKPRKRKGKTYWYAQWRENGKARSKELGLCSKVSRAEAEGRLAEILSTENQKAGNAVVPIYTFAGFIEAVYLPVFRRKWKASTAMIEENRLRANLVEPLAGRTLREITREELQRLLDIKAGTQAQSMVAHHRFRLRSIFELAMAEGAVDRNPAAALFTPRRCQPGRERHVLSPEELLKMFSVLDLREQLITRLATCEGMRPGEVLALQVGDVEADAVWVRRRLYKGDIDTPKTKRSFRQVALSEGTKKLLDFWVARIGTSNPEAWLFPSENPSTPIWRDNVWRRNMLPRLKTVGLQWATFQVMRRTFATLSKQAGVDAHTRSAQMGNTVDVNENEYAVSTLESKVAAVRRLETTVIQ